MKLRSSFARAAVTGLVLGLAASSGNASDHPATAPSPQPESGFGGYLAALHAQEDHDYRGATDFIDAALAADPDNYNLMRHAFALRVSAGRVDQAASLARKIAAHDGAGGLAGLVLVE